MAAYSSILAWGIPWIEESGGLQPMGPQRVDLRPVQSVMTTSTKTTTTITLTLEGVMYLFIISIECGSSKPVFLILKMI